jgi:hypothetical protein
MCGERQLYERVVIDLLEPRLLNTQRPTSLGTWAASLAIEAATSDFAAFSSSRSRWRLR